MAGEVVPVDFGARKRVRPEFLGVLARIKFEPEVRHDPGTLPEIGPDGITTWPERLGIPEPAPAITREEMIQKAAQAFARDAVHMSDETAQLVYETTLALDDDEVDRAYNQARFDTGLV